MTCAESRAAQITASVTARRPRGEGPAAAVSQTRPAAAMAGPQTASATPALRRSRLISQPASISAAVTASPYSTAVIRNPWGDGTPQIAEDKADHRTAGEP